MAASVWVINTQTTLRWVYDNANGQSKYLSFATPIGGTGDAGDNCYCGKAVFTDLHATISELIPPRRPGHARC